MYGKLTFIRAFNRETVNKSLDLLREIFALANCLNFLAYL